ncbi:MAG TPA: UvrD-helicase domain-containing protein, partial [Myxococcota bacterium]|nr:UvrD-helicase domain-containing protein [Myxococcota bacterium]
ALQPTARGPSELQKVVGRRFGAVLIDEFQDTDPVQWEIFDRLFRTPRHRLFLIGDPKQAIYSFRRADVKTYIAARKKADRVHDLSVNRRSDPPLIAALNALFSRRDKNRVFASEEIGYQPVSAPDDVAFTAIDRLGAPIRLLWVERNERNAPSRFGDPATVWMNEKNAEADITKLVASDIVETLERGLILPGKNRPVSPGDMAVLVPRNKQASAVQRALQDLGVPAVIHGPYSVFTTEEARELEVVLGAILEPSRVALVKKALVTRLLGVTASELVRMETNDAKALELWIDQLRQWRDDWHSRSFIEGFRKLVSFRVKDLLSLVDGERRLANVLQLGEILHLTASERGLKAPGLLAWFSRQIKEKREDDKNQVRLETDEPAVQIVTVHKAKGLEYPFVWCPFLWQEPQAPNAGKSKSREFVLRRHEEVLLDLDVDTESSDRQSNAALKLYDLRAEQLRQLYVALTRAKHQVTIFGCATWPLPKSALGYLLFGNGSAEDAQSFDQEIKRLDDLRKKRDNDLMALAVNGLDSDLMSVAYAGRIRKERLDLPPAQPALEARKFAPERRLDTDWRRTSFSGLAAELSRTQTFDEEKVQAASDEDRTEYDLFAAASPVEVALADLPSGRMIGNCIHKIFEILDFRDIDEARIRPVVERELENFGVGAAHTDTLTRGVRQVLTTPLDASGFTLSELAREHRLSEMDFVFPTRTDPAFSHADLIDAFEQHGGPHLAGWLEQVRAGRFRDVRGFLTGSIDLAFKNPRDGRYYVLDWKSNHLGRRAADYDLASMRAAMDHHHYHLQYHLYVVAFARYLGHRVPGFDPERDLGGAYYLFVRGMAPSHPLHTGVYFDRPPVALVTALDEVFTAQRQAVHGGHA